MGKEMFLGHIPSGIRPIIDAGILPDDGSPEWKRMVFVYQYPEMKISYPAYIEIMWMGINKHPLYEEWHAWFQKRFGWENVTDYAVTLEGDYSEEAAEDEEDDDESVTGSYVTLARKSTINAAADTRGDAESVTEQDKCIVCGGPTNKRGGAKTCSAKCRKRKSRMGVL